MLYSERRTRKRENHHAITKDQLHSFPAWNYQVSTPEEMKKTLHQIAVENYATDEARETVKGYRENLADEGEHLALARLQRDTSPEFLTRLFGDDESNRTAYLESVKTALPHLAIYLK